MIGPVSFSQPAYLTIVPLAAGLWALCRAMKKRRRSFSLYLAFVVFLGLALSGPFYVEQGPFPTTLVYCLDTSASLSQEERMSFLHMARALSESPLPEVSQQFIVFGKTVRRSEGVPASLDPEAGTRTQDAISLALDLIEKSGNPGKIALFTDGGQEKESPDWVRACQERKVPVFVFAPVDRKGDCRLLSLRLPPEIPEGVNLPIAVCYGGNFEGELSLSIQIDETPYLQKQVNAQKSGGVWTIEGPPLPSGFFRLEARIHGDLRPENNLGHATARIFSQPKVLLLSDLDDPLLKTALEIQHVPVEHRRWGEPPSEWAYPLVILDRPKEVEDSFLVRCDDYLGKGGNLLVMDGHGISWGWLPAMFEEKSRKNPPSAPLPQKPPAKKEKSRVQLQLRSVALVLLIDRSGSMIGEKLDLARKAAMASISRLWVHDLVGVVAFDTEAKWVVPLGAQGDMQWVSRRIEGIEVGGGTSIYPALEKAYDALKMVRAQIKHVILLSDGYDEDGMYARGKLEPMVRQMKNSDISVTTIGVGDFDPLLMPLIAKWGGGEFYFASSYEQIPLMMVRDVDRILNIRNIPLKGEKREKEEEREKKKDDLAYRLNQELAEQAEKNAEKMENYHAFFVKRAFDSLLLSSFTQFPPLRRYEKFIARKGAQQELFVDEDPLLLHWQWRLGKVMMWNSEMESWKDWESYPKFWARMARFLSSGTFDLPRARIQCIPSTTGNRNAILTVTGPREEVMTSLSVKGNFPFYPHDATTWVAEVPPERTGKWQPVEARIFQDGRLIAQTESAFIESYDKEFDDFEVRTEWMKEAFSRTGGGMLPGEGGRFQAPFIRPRPYHLDFICVWMALFFGFLWFMRNPSQN